MTFKALTPLF